MPGLLSLAAFLLLGSVSELSRCAPLLHTDLPRPASSRCNFRTTALLLLLESHWEGAVLLIHYYKRLEHA